MVFIMDKLNICDIVGIMMDKNIGYCITHIAPFSDDLNDICYCNDKKYSGENIKELLVKINAKNGVGIS